MVQKPASEVAETETRRAGKATEDAGGESVRARASPRAGGAVSLALARGARARAAHAAPLHRRLRV